MISLFFGKIFPRNAVLIHDDWGTSMKIRSSTNLTADQWRSAKDAAIHNFLIHYIDGTLPDGGMAFTERVLHFLCDCASTETVASCLNFESVLDYIMSTCPYKVELIIRWTDGTSKQYKNVGNVGMEKYLCIKYNIRILHCFFPTCWGKGKIDLLGGIVHGLYTKLVAILSEKATDLGLVVSKMNELYSVPGSTRAESALSLRVFFYVSQEENDRVRSERTTWKTLNFPSGVTLLILFLNPFGFFIITLRVFVLRCVSNIVS